MTVITVLNDITVITNDLERVKREATDIVEYYASKMSRGLSLSLMYKEDYLEIAVK